MYRHIVLFRVHDEVPDERVTEAIDSLRSLAVMPGISSWLVVLSLDSRKGRVIVEDATFSDREAFESFRVDDRHAEVAARMAGISDWWVGDYELAPRAPGEVNEPARLLGGGAPRSGVCST